MGVEEAGRSAQREADDTRSRIRELSSEMRRTYARQDGFAAAALSEPWTAAVLQPLADLGWRILHDRRWPGSSSANVDHLAVGPPGVAVIDTKHWSGSVEVRGDRLWCGDDDRHESVENMLRLVAAVEELLVEVDQGVAGPPAGLSPVHVLPVYAFTKFVRSRDLRACVGRVRLVAIRQLPALLAAQPVVLSESEIALVAAHLEQHMPPASEGSIIPRQRPSPTGLPIRPEPLPPDVPTQPADDADCLFDVPDLAEQLAKAAAGPLVEWMGFLHPGQARLVRRSFAGPARVRGATGTGKSVVMLHRAAWLAETRPGRVLVTSFVRTLPRHQRAVYEQLSQHTLDKVDFLGVHEVARQLLREAGQRLTVRQERIEAAFDTAWTTVGALGRLAVIADRRYWREEIDYVIKGRGLRTFVEYDGLDRRGRSIALATREKVQVWRLCTAYTEELERRDTYDHNDVLSAAVDLVTRHPPEPGWSAVAVDEVQDLPLLGVRLCALLGGTGHDGLFLVGDGQQAIYPGGFTLPEAGVSVVGRAVVLRVNYRNTRQIIESACQLVEGHEFSDLDGTLESGFRDVDVIRDGPEPVRQTAPDRRRLALRLAIALRQDARDGVDWGDMAVLTLSRDAATFLRDYLADRGIPVRDVKNWDGRPDHEVKVDTVHRAKGLDFGSVYLPQLHAKMDVSDEAKGVDEHETRRLRQQFVGQTRARDRLWIGTVVPRPRDDVSP